MPHFQNGAARNNPVKQPMEMLLAARAGQLIAINGDDGGSTHQLGWLQGWRMAVAGAGTEPGLNQEQVNQRGAASALGHR
jgi:hypothetical protein